MTKQYDAIQKACLNQVMLAKRELEKIEERKRREREEEYLVFDLLVGLAAMADDFSSYQDTAPSSVNTDDYSGGGGDFGGGGSSGDW